jgi:hypothetical protein
MCVVNKSDCCPALGVQRSCIDSSDCGFSCDQSGTVEQYLYPLASYRYSSYRCRQQL